MVFLERANSSLFQFAFSSRRYSDVPKLMPIYILAADYRARHQSVEFSSSFPKVLFIKNAILN